MENLMIKIHNTHFDIEIGLFGSRIESYFECPYGPQDIWFDDINDIHECDTCKRRFKIVLQEVDGP